MRNLFLTLFVAASALSACKLTPQWDFAKDPDTGWYGVACRSEDPEACGSFQMPNNWQATPGYQPMQIRPGFYVIVTRGEMRQFCKQASQLHQYEINPHDTLVLDAAINEGLCPRDMVYPLVGVEGVGRGARLTHAEVVSYCATFPDSDLTKLAAQEGICS
jgi:hypothetical protein